jgi:hypothetical protein
VSLSTCFPEKFAFIWISLPILPRPEQRLPSCLPHCLAALRHIVIIQITAANK